MVAEPTDNPYVRSPDTDFAPVADLTDREAREQADLLVEAIDYHDHRYYVADDPVIADRTYDALFDRLAALEAAFDLDNERSPTRRVGAEPLDELPTREHVAELLSLDSSGDADEVRAFDQRVREVVDDPTYSMEPKFDGFSVEVVYEDGEYDRAVTRGDGTTGEEVTANVRTIRSVPLRLPESAPAVLALRGEVYMPRPGFVDLNERRIEAGEDPFANPRNAAAGTVRQLDPSTVADRPLDVFFYDVLEASVELSRQRAVWDLLERLGFRVTEHNAFGDVEDFIAYRESLREKRDALDFEIDGVVAKVDDFEKRERLGETARHPRWAFAYKFPARTGETTVQRIVVQVGRTGKLTPVALLDPVDVQGVTISRATLHNATQVRELGVSEGAVVEIERAGDVIPEVASVVEDGDGDFAMPDRCPVCDSPVQQEGEYHFCTGDLSCPAQLRRSLEHYCSRGALDIEGVGEKVARTLVEEGLVETLADLYELAPEEIAALEGFGERSAAKLVAEIDASREPRLSEFLFGLGIRHVGSERAADLAAAFSIEGLRDADRDELLAVPDVGPEVADSVVSFFENDRNQESLDALLEHVTPERKTRESDDDLDGLTVVFTGSIEGYTRRELADELERRGANVTSSVSGATDYLVVGDNPGQRKREDAEREGVETIDGDVFVEQFLGESG